MRLLPDRCCYSVADRLNKPTLVTTGLLNELLEVGLIQGNTQLISVCSKLLQRPLIVHGCGNEGDRFAPYKPT